MLRCALFALIAVLTAVPLSAQSRVYAGGIVAADAGDRGGYSTLGTFPAAGGFVGVRFHDAWSIEVHVDRGFGKSAPRPQIEIFGTSTVRDHSGIGTSVFITWKLRRQSRVGAAVMMGISSRTLSTRRVSFTKIPADDPYPVTEVRSQDGGGGLAGGAFFPIALGAGWSLAPEVRVTFGVTGESGIYVPFYSGVRVSYGF